MNYKILISGEHTGERFFIPYGTELKATGFICIQNCTFVVEDFYERMNEKVIDLTEAQGLFQNSRIIPAEGDWERWLSSPNNPYRRTGQWSDKLEKVLEWSVN